MSKQKHRRLAAIMFTDIVGYSSMMQNNEAMAAQQRARHREVFNRLHAQHNGEIIQYFGDGTLSVFYSTTDAVECAVQLQRELKQAPQVPIRVGIHTGDITFSEEEAYGDGVNIASRIESLCVPGGVFLSGKAYDDIKNHPDLRARAIGQSPLKNIHQRVDLYALTNPGITVPEYDWEPAQPMGQAAALPPKRKRRRKKWVAAMLAFFFGVFGIHRFYLDQRNLAILYLTLFFLGAFILPGVGELVAIPAVLGFVDFLVFLGMSRDTFDERYNRDYLQQEQRLKDIAVAKANDPKRLLHKQRNKYLDQAQMACDNYDYTKGIEVLQKAVEIKYDDPETHFFLARCYSALENTRQALHHLDLAIAFGLPDMERLQTEDDLSFLRIQPEYETFKQHDYRLPKELPSPQSGELELDEPVPADLLDQLARLQKEREAGRITDEEYQIIENRLRDERTAKD